MAAALARIPAGVNPIAAVSPRKTRSTPNANSTEETSRSRCAILPRRMIRENQLFAARSDTMVADVHPV